MAAKILPQDLKDTGFTFEMFGLTALAFDAWLQPLIDEQSALLSGRFGTSVYGSATAPTSDYVKRAEKSLCMVELWNRRIIRKLGQAKGDDVSISAEEKARDAAQTDADFYFSKLNADDYAGEVVETDHSETADA